MTQGSTLADRVFAKDGLIQDAASHRARFEVHLTTGPLDEEGLAAFEELAQQLGTRALVIELSRGSHPLQPMLSFEHEGELIAALAQAEDLATKAADKGHPICRCKIERRAEEETDASAQAAGHYLEWHGRITVGKGELTALAMLCRRHGAHLSNNALKGSAARYVTMRESGRLDVLRERVTALCAELETQAWRFDKQQWERVVFDSNLPLDTGWLEA